MLIEHGYAKSVIIELILKAHGTLGLQIVRHYGCEPPGRFTTGYQDCVVNALNKYDYDWSNAHGKYTGQSMRAQTDADDKALEQQLEQKQFIADWLEVLDDMTGSPGGAVGAGVTSWFTDDPKKIAAGAKIATAISDVMQAHGTAVENKSSYSPTVVRPARKVPTAIGSWRYTGEQPIVEANTPRKAPTQLSVVPEVPRPLDVTHGEPFPSDAKTTTKTPIQVPTTASVAPTPSAAKGESDTGVQKRPPVAPSPKAKRTPKAQATLKSPMTPKTDAPGKPQKPRRPTPKQTKAQQDAKYSDSLNKRIARIRNQLSEAKQRTVEYKEARVAEGENEKGGPSKAIWNRSEELYVLERARAHPDRVILEQVQFVGVKRADGKLSGAAHIAGKGRTLDFLEIDGGRALGGEAKSKAEIVHSVEDLHEPNMLGDFNPKTKLGVQRGKEKTIIDEAITHGGNLVFRGKDVRTGADITLEVSPNDYQSAVVAYDQLRPD